ncbi:hypothetical protein SDC9_199863 [bioreactor metagenome]|uniref:Uncharacterized protein n=1 Tax=bioreactor metagenome TaxID=1076179 RepID=A0A645ILR9_9ZZZZ
MALEGEADLQDAESEQYDPYGPDDGKNKVGKVVHNGNGIVAGRVSDGGEAETQDQGAKDGEYHPCFFIHFHAGSPSLFLLLVWFRGQETGARSTGAFCANRAARRSLWHRRCSDGSSGDIFRPCTAGRPG